MCVRCDKEMEDILANDAGMLPHETTVIDEVRGKGTVALRHEPLDNEDVTNERVCWYCGIDLTLDRPTKRLRRRRKIGGKHGRNSGKVKSQSK